MGSPVSNWNNEFSAHFVLPVSIYVGSPVCQGTAFPQLTHVIQDHTITALSYTMWTCMSQPTRATRQQRICACQNCRGQYIHSPPVLYGMIKLYMGSPVSHWNKPLSAHLYYSVSLYTRLTCLLGYSSNLADLYLWVPIITAHPFYMGWCNITIPL